MRIPIVNSTLFKILVKSIIVLVFIYSCEPKGPILGPSYHVYKFRDGNDYTKFVQVTMNDKKTRIISFPVNGMEYFQVGYWDFYKGYYLGGAYNPNTVILNILVEDYDSIFKTLSEYSFEGYILDLNPYEEFYYDDDRYLRNECLECLYSYDTSKFHYLVDEQTLGLYLNKVL